MILRTWNLFLELPGRVKSLFSPIFRLPSLMLEEVEVNGSGAATLDSFYAQKISLSRQNTPIDDSPLHTFCRPWRLLCTGWASWFEFRH